MTAAQRERLRDGLTPLVEVASLSDVLLALAEIARVRGVLLRETDAAVSRVWIKAGERIEMCVGSMTI